MPTRQMDFLHDTKAAIGTVFVTIGTGLALTLDIIPDDIGKLASLLGIVLSGILIYNHVRAKHLHAYQERLEKQANRLDKLQADLRVEQGVNTKLGQVLNNLSKPIHERRTRKR